MTSEKTPRSRRERPAKPALTREGIVVAAVELLQAEGLPKVTMRRLAEQLDTGAASLYVYVRNTAELHAAILDELLGTVRPPARGDWRDRAAALLVRYTDMLIEYPSLAGAALVARPHGPHYLRLLETLLGLLADGGVPPAQSAWGVDLLLLVATATAAEHAGGPTPEQERDWDTLTRAVHDLPSATHPHLASLATTLLGGTPTERRDWLFHVLLTALQYAPEPPRSTS